MDNLDLSTNNQPLILSKVDFISKSSDDLLSLLKIKDPQLFQRLKARWMKEGDVNSSFFHASVKCRNRKLSILALKKYEVLIERVEEIHKDIFSYFSVRFKE